jgi:hypothetical protein
LRAPTRSKQWRLSPQWGQRKPCGQRSRSSAASHCSSVPNYRRNSPKLVASIVAISGIELLKAFVNTGGYSNTDLAWKVGIHGMLVVSGVLVAWMHRSAASAKH